MDYLLECSSYPNFSVRIAQVGMQQEVEGKLTNIKAMFYIIFQLLLH